MKKSVSIADRCIFGIKIGDLASEVLAKLGSPSRSTKDSIGEITWYYDDIGCLFEFHPLSLKTYRMMIFYPSNETLAEGISIGSTWRFLEKIFGDELEFETDGNYLWIVSSKNLKFDCHYTDNKGHTVRGNAEHYKDLLLVNRIEIGFEFDEMPEILNLAIQKSITKINLFINRPRFKKISGKYLKNGSPNEYLNENGHASVTQWRAHEKLAVQERET
jgi:hypothetical protein